MRFVTDRADELLERLVSWAQGRDDVHVVLLVGSQARSDRQADELSDIDIVLTVDEPDEFLSKDEWLEQLGDTIVQTVEPTAFGGLTERRVLFASGQDVDFSIVPAELGPLLVDFKDLVEVRELVGRGVRVLVDKTQLAQEIATIEPPDPASALLSADDYRGLSNRFWYRLIVAAKKWRRGELWVAMSACEGTLTALTIDLARWWTRLREPEVDSWHGARFIESWLDPSTLAALSDTRTGYGRTEIALGLHRVMTLFEQLEIECCKAAGYSPAVDHDTLRDLLAELLDQAPLDH